MTKYNWVSTGPGGCDSHCIESPCGPCAQENDKSLKRPSVALIEEEPQDEHECDTNGETDIDLCSECGDHASFCSTCGESSCCGASPIDTDYEIERDE